MALLDSSSGYLTFFRHIHYRMPSVRFSKIIILNLFILFVVITFLAHYYLPKIGNDDPVAEIHQKGVQMEDLDSIKAIDLKSRIEEMIRIKVSVSNELRELESRRQKLQSDISILTQRMEDLKVDYSRQQVDLDRLRISVEQAQYAQKEVQEKNTPFIGAPKRILPSLDDNIHMPPSTLKGIRNCKNFLCFDYSRCSLTSGFPVYFYQPEDFGTWNSKDHYLRSAVMEALNVNIHITFDPSIACIFVVLVGEIVHGKKDPKSLEHYLSSLNYWNGNGRNHILFNLVSETNETNNVFAGVNTGRAIVVQSHFTTKDFRPHFDIISPPLFYKKDKTSKLYLYSPARRKFLLSYQGEYRTSSYVLKSNFRKLSTATLSDEVNGMENAKMTDSQSEDVENLIVNILKEMQLSALGDNFFFQFSCAGSSSPGYDSEWLMCGTHETRLEVLQDSTFSLLVSPSDYNLISTPQMHVRLIEALKTGAVPVVLGDHVHLPFDEVVDWRRAAVILPKARVSELHYYLRTISDSDIIAMRHQGRLLWEHYLAGPRQVVATILTIIRNRIQIPAPACREESSPSVFNETFRPLKAEFAAIQDPDPEENLGPVESPFPSLSFRRNLTIANSKTYFVWNEQFDPFILYPHTPFDPVLPSESKFIGSSFGFRPIGQGAGGSGKEFSEALGGNYPREQFTIVILTYEREAVLIDSLQRLRGLPYLNKVVVVWNSEKLPSADLRWPEISVPIHVIKAKKNSLNNRFLPFDVIETEAVLSVDDDAHLRHDEIVFGFRVWREARDRIVGFPGRYHAWYSLNGGWHYNSNYSCELSMVLTGAAFFHKYYTYLYSYSMPQVIRDKVDEYMNCEDIAMNFLVSHVTRKPPIKVTSRWTFRCPGCPVSLSEEDSHFQERHRCIDFFSQVYGYMPLLNTQFRADSVLFKTRIPHDKQKCFKFI